MGLSQDIGRRIKQSRLRHGYTQERLAEIIGVSDGAISSYELGDTLPSLKNAVALAQLFGISLDWLFLGGTMNTSKEPPEEQALTEEEIRLLTTFRKVSKPRKKIVLDMLKELARMETGK